MDENRAWTTRRLRARRALPMRMSSRRRYTGGGLHVPRRPDQHVLAFGHVSERVALDLDPRRQHRVVLDRHLGVPELPRRVVDVGAQYAAAIGRVQAVALREEVL